MSTFQHTVSTNLLPFTSKKSVASEVTESLQGYLFDERASSMNKNALGGVFFFVRKPLFAPKVLLVISQ